MRLRGLEKNVNELKEQIFRTKARLNLLKETVLGGVIGASRALIRHKNEMGSSFRLIKAAFALDGVQIAAKSEGNLAELQEFDVYNGAIQPGSHTLSVALIYQGNGFGVFSYLKGYKFNVKSSHTFVAGESRARTSPSSVTRRATSRPSSPTSQRSISASTSCRPVKAARRRRRRRNNGVHGQPEPASCHACVRCCWFCRVRAGRRG